ncbi:MAG: PIN domain-containing protein [Candidatus Korarchaeota archaeon]|nr:PIN domain-containing protein [Candidatus Korarchaeota archaeon]
MDYLDTSYIISLAVKSDVNHQKAVRLERSLRDPVISKLVVAETYSVFSRMSDDPVPLAEYAIRRSRARIEEANLNEALDLSILLSEELRLKTLDLLHASLAKIIGADRFVTFDRDILNKGLSPLEIEVIGRVP